MNGRICIQVYVILEILLICDTDWRKKKQKVITFENKEINPASREQNFVNFTVILVSCTCKNQLLLNKFLLNLSNKTLINGKKVVNSSNKNFVNLPNKTFLVRFYHVIYTFSVKLRSATAWMSRKSLLETGTINKV